MGSGATKFRSQSGSSARISGGQPIEQEQDDAHLDPGDFITQYQNVIHSGVVWKLNYGANPEHPDEWLKRKMWLTDTGGLFYFSRQHGALRGCSLSGLFFNVPEKQALGRFILEASFESPDGFGHRSVKTKVHPTVLATETVEERDAWFESVQSVQGREKADGRIALDPLEPLVGRGLHHGRTRLGNGQRKEHAHSTPGGVNCDKDQLTRCGTSFRSVCTTNAYYQNKTNRAQGTPYSVGPSIFRQPKPVTRRDSQCNFASQPQTVLVLDWDDTLFPTTFIREDAGLDFRRSIDDQMMPGPAMDDLKQRLSMLSDKVETFIHLACSMAHVLLITLAQPPWVEISCVNFMPRLQRLLSEHSIKVIYARERITEAAKEAYYANAFKTTLDENDFWMRAKATTMQQEFASIHTALNSSWKNLISIGDSDYERTALLCTAEEYVARQSKGAYVNSTGLTNELITKTGQVLRVRSKTVKLLDEPSCEEMLAQVTLLISWLPHIVNRDSGLEVELVDSTDDALLREVHCYVTGEAGEELRWLVLGGLEAVEPCTSEATGADARGSSENA